MNNVKVIELAGILDGVSGGELRQTVETAIGAGQKYILLDCAAVEFMDSSGLGALVIGLKQAQAAGGRLALASLNDQVQMLLELTDMASAFEIAASRAAFEQSI